MSGYYRSQGRRRSAGCVYGIVVLFGVLIAVYVLGALVFNGIIRFELPESGVNYGYGVVDIPRAATAVPLATDIPRAATGVPLATEIPKPATALPLATEIPKPATAATAVPLATEIPKPATAAAASCPGRARGGRCGGAAAAGMAEQMGR